MLRVSIKCDELRRVSDEWQALEAAFPHLPERFREAGIDDVEASVALTGEPEDDARKLEALRTWYTPWRAAGVGLHLHPYTQGRANPATYVAGENDAPVESLLRAAETLARLAAGGPTLSKLVYHAAEAKEESAGRDPRAERGLYLERSRRFLATAWARLDREGWPILLVTETQLPTDPDRPNVRIGDRPEEIAALVEGRPASVCLDTGHYLVSRERLASPPEPELLAHVAHMHLHDVEGVRDHRPLTAGSRRVANYVRLAARRGRLTSATLEYKLSRALPDPATLDARAMVAHAAEAAAWVKGWASAGAGGPEGAPGA